MRPADWQRVREEQHLRTGHRCEDCRRQVFVRLDVVRNGRAFMCLCRACRVRWQSAAITAKRLATIRRRGGHTFTKQTSLPLENTT